ncbi:MAG: hypothetical protein JSV43_05215, partial [Methanobacteriota archaeon]
MMKARKMLAGIWAVVMLLSGLGIAGFMTLPVVAQPNAHMFSGSILIDGLDASAGTYIYAEIDGTLYGQDSDQVGGGYQGGIYSLAVSGEDSADPIAKEGGVDGENVIFWVKPPVGGPYIANQAPAFVTGGISNVNLVVQTMTQPNRLVMDQINITTGDWVLLYNPGAASTTDLSQGWTLVDSYGASSGALTGTVPPMSNSALTYSIPLLDSDGNAWLTWQDPLGTIAGGNTIVMDKVEWGTHLGDSEATGGETIGLDKGTGSVWDPNLPDCGADMGYWRVDPNVDTDRAEDFNRTGVFCVYLPGVKQPPQLWPRTDLGPGYLTDYLDPEVGDTTTLFTWQVHYADVDNDPPQAPPTLRVWNFLTGIDVSWSPVSMVFTGIPAGGTPGVYFPYPDEGEYYTYADTMPIGVDWRYEICVTDVNLMSNCTAVFDAPDVGDSTPPEIQNVLLDGLPAQTVAPGTSVTLTTLIDDSTTGGSLIGGADWLFTCGPWPGNATIFQDGFPDSATENMLAVIDTTLLGDGVWNVYIRAWDVVPNYNDTCPPGSFAPLTISSVDAMGPEISNVLVNGQPAIKIQPGTSVTLTAFVDDRNDPENYLIGLAEYSINPPSARIAMDAADGTYDGEFEDVTATIVTTGWADGIYQICVYARDTQTPPNSNDTGLACATIEIDGTPPTSSGLTINGQAIIATIQEGDDAYINATIDDTFTGNSNIAGAEFTYGALAFPGTMMNAADGAFDSVMED